MIEYKACIFQYAAIQQKYYANEISMDELEASTNEIKEKLLSSISKLEEPAKRNVEILMLLLSTKLKNSIIMEADCKAAIEKELNDFSAKISELMQNDLKDMRNSDRSYKNMCHDKYMHKTSKTKRSNFPKHILRILKSWLKNHIDTPYPTEMEKIALSEATGLDQTQINNWFINARRRLLPDLKK